MVDPPADGSAAPPSVLLPSFHAPGIDDESCPACSTFLLSLALPEPVTLARMDEKRLGVGTFPVLDTSVLMGGGLGLDERTGNAAAPASVLFLDPQAFGGDIEALVPAGVSDAAGTGVLFLFQGLAGAAGGPVGFWSADGAAFLFHGLEEGTTGLAGLLFAADA